LLAIFREVSSGIRCTVFLCSRYEWIRITRIHS